MIESETHYLRRVNEPLFEGARMTLSELIAQAQAAPSWAYIDVSPELLIALARVAKAAQMLLLICEHANRGAFDNGVTDNTGKDEGDWESGQFIDDARIALAALRDAGVEP